MNKKQLKFFVLGLFSVIVVLFLQTQNRKSNVFNEIIDANLNQIENVRFYKDFLRNEGDLNLPITKEVHLENFLKALKTIKPSNHSLKSLKTEVLFRVQLNLKVKENRFLTIDIHKTQQTRKLGIISITQGETNVYSAGTYKSEDLLQWVVTMQQKSGFENIGGAY